MGGFVDLSDVKSAHGISLSDVTWDAEISGWIDYACDLIEEHTDREITLASSPEARIFPVGPYATTGTILVGDLSETPTTVRLLDSRDAAVRTLAADDFHMSPRFRRRAWEPLTMLQIRSGVTLCEDQGIEVTGIWGFPQVPGVVKEAVIETVREWLRGTQGFTNSAPDIDEPSVRVASRGLPPSAKRMVRRIVRITIR